MLFDDVQRCGLVAPSVVFVWQCICMLNVCQAIIVCCFSFDEISNVKLCGYDDVPDGLRKHISHRHRRHLFSIQTTKRARA